MKRRKFIKTGLLASAIPTIGGIIYGSSIKNSKVLLIDPDCCSCEGFHLFITSER